MNAFSAVDSAVSKGKASTDQEKDWRAWQDGGERTITAAERTAKVSGKRALPQFPRLGGDKGGGSHDKVGEKRQRDSPEELAKETEGEVQKVHAGYQPSHAEEGQEKSKKRSRNQALPKGDASALDKNVASNDDSGWSKLVEPGTGKVYYFNNSTGETSYTEPGSLDRTLPPFQNQHHRSTNPMEQVQAALARRNQKVQSDTARISSNNKANQPHVATGQSKKARPPRNRWDEMEDPLTRRKYYINQKGETQWEKPAGYVGERHNEAPKDFGKAKKASASKLSWTRGVQGGKVFWFCRETGETRFGARPKA